MIDLIKRIRRIIDKTHPRGHLPYGVDDIRAAVVEVSGIDCVRFNGYPDDGSNPVKGRFRRFDGMIAPYAGNGCIVEIDYNLALRKEPWWLQLVAAKDFNWSPLKNCVTRSRRIRPSGSVASSNSKP